MTVEGISVGVYNEWGRLREAFVGIEDDYVEPEYIPAFAWMGREGIEYCKKYGGRKSSEVLPDKIRRLREQIEGHVKALEDFGTVVNRNQPLIHQEEQTFLDNVQKGRVYSGGADFFRVIGNNVILLNNLRYPFRRKQVYTVRPVLEPLLRHANVRYVALPPASPHYTDDDMYLENGDIMVDGYNVYVGMSGLATSEAGLNWLGQFLGHEYRIHRIDLAPTILHLDTVLGLNRPGLLTYYPEFVRELPRPLKHWDNIEITALEGEQIHFGANNLSLDENTIIVSEEYNRLVPEYKKRGMEVVTLPLDVSIEYGSGPRCLTGVLRRDP